MVMDILFLFKSMQIVKNLSQNFVMDDKNFIKF